MIKELLRKHEGVGDLAQYRYQCLSNLPINTKKQICRSWIRGSDSDWISRYHGVSEDEVRACTEELIQMASSLGKKRLVNKGVRASDGYVYLIGEMSQFWLSAELKKELGYEKMTELKILRERFDELTGIPPKTKPARRRENFKFVHEDTSGASPHDGSKMKKLHCGLQMSAELKSDGMNFELVGDIYYCMNSLREFFVYEGDDNGNPKGLYEVAYEHID